MCIGLNRNHRDRFNPSLRLIVAVWSCQTLSEAEDRSSEKTLFAGAAYRLRVPVDVTPNAPLARNTDLKMVYE